MKIYTKDNYIKVAEMPKNELKTINFDQCKQPTETLKSYYNRQKEKPAVLINAGFFGMSNGVTVFNYINEFEQISYNKSYQWGMGLTADKDLQYGCMTHKNWKDFISGFPVLLDNCRKCDYSYAQEINYKARRTAIGYNEDTIFAVCVEYPGMTFPALQNLMLELGCKYAINLDGGGSTKMLYNGESFTTDATNRAVDNVIAFYLNPSVYLNPDDIESFTFRGKTLSINKKIIPDNFTASKYICSWVQKGWKMKPCRNMIPKGIVIHNTPAINVNPATTMAEQYVRATYNENMGGSIVHYYVSGYDEIWQMLDLDEQGWHASDGSSRRKSHRGDQIGGNLDCIAIECIGDSQEAKDATALLAAWLCDKLHFDATKDIYTHNYFMGQPDKIVNGVDKNCPLYILPHWNDFIKTIYQYQENLLPMTEDINIKYRAYVNTKDRWYSWITNYQNQDGNGYAGLTGQPISAIQVQLTSGDVEYRVHTNGKWYSWVTNYNDENNNGYAGVLTRNADGIQIRPKDKTKTIQYRVHLLKENRWLPWVENDSDYAGIFGREFDKIQMTIN